MITDTNVLIGHNQNLYHLAQHKHAFDIGYIYPLDIAEMNNLLSIFDVKRRL